MNQTNLLKMPLPKWPQMLVSGKPVTRIQAKEIIFRTDAFVYTGRGGNDEIFQDRYKKLAGLDRFEDYCNEQFDFCNNIKKQINFIDTIYVKNNWGSCCFVYGAHGWCSPEGEICYIDNIGKWPDVEEVLNDWNMIAAAFPFLDLHVTLMSGESCESETTRPLVNIRVIDGIATIQEPDLNVHPRSIFGLWEIREIKWNKISRRFSFDINEHEKGLPDSWYMDFGLRIRKIAVEIK